MKYKINNPFLTAEISSKGGELLSIKDKAGREYIWQGDEATWPDHGPNLFPYIGRMTDQSYRYKGQLYHMNIHGFLPYMEMEKKVQTEDTLTLCLKSSDLTMEQYPFAFVLEITWKLSDTKLDITYCIQNMDEETMYFGIGGHPGFCVPIEEGLSFEDYRLDFGECKDVKEILLSEDCFVLDKSRSFPLKDDRYIPLSHRLFDHDSIILKDMPKKVKISSEKAAGEIQVTFEDMNYLGIWHWPHAEVNYVCIEPWSSLPSRKGIVEDLATQPNLLSLESKKVYTNTWSISITDHKYHQES